MTVVGVLILGGRDQADLVVQQQGWGAKVIDRLAVDLRAEFHDMTSLSRSNLHYMRALADAWPDGGAVVQQPVGQLAWGHITVPLDNLDDQPARDWYAAAAVERGWSRAVLLNQINNRTHQRPAQHRRTSPTACPPPTPTEPANWPRTRTSSTSSA